MRTVGKGVGLGGGVKVAVGIALGGIGLTWVGSGGSEKEGATEELDRMQAESSNSKEISSEQKRDTDFIRENIIYSKDRVNKAMRFEPTKGSIRRLTMIGLRATLARFEGRMDT